MLKLLKPKTGESVRENTEDETENETRRFYTPTKSVRINSTQNHDPNVSRNRLDLFRIQETVVGCHHMRTHSALSCRSKADLEFFLVKLFSGILPWF